MVYQTHELSRRTREGERTFMKRSILQFLHRCIFVNLKERNGGKTQPVPFFLHAPGACDSADGAPILRGAASPAPATCCCSRLAPAAPVGVGFGGCIFDLLGESSLIPHQSGLQRAPPPHPTPHTRSTVNTGITNKGTFATGCSSAPPPVLWRVGAEGWVGGGGPWLHPAAGPM